MSHKNHTARRFSMTDRYAIVALTFGICALGWNIGHNMQARHFESCEMIVNASVMTGSPMTLGQCMQTLDHTKE